MADESSQPIVIVVDALELRRAGIASLVEAWASAIGYKTIAISPEDILSYSQSGIDIRFVILSIGGSSLHEGELQDCARKVHDLFAGVPCAIISDRKEAEEAVAAARLGEQAFLCTSMEPSVARQALTFILGGGTFFPREALLQSASPARVSPNHSTQPHESDSEGLTKRQNDVLERLRLGRSNKHIARDLNMQESTVKVHVRQIMRKLGASNRTQAALFASSTRVSQNPMGDRVNGSMPLVHSAKVESADDFASLPNALPPIPNGLPTIPGAFIIDKSLEVHRPVGQ